MKKYSIEWKRSQQHLHGGWAQYHGGESTNSGWKWHYISQDTERHTGDYLTKKDCETANEKAAI